MTQRQQAETTRIECLISGYFNELEANFKPLRIPIDIRHVCLQFYHLYDYFTIHGDNILLDKSRKIAIGTIVFNLQY